MEKQKTKVTVPLQAHIPGADTYAKVKEATMWFKPPARGVQEQNDEGGGTVAVASVAADGSVQSLDEGDAAPIGSAQGLGLGGGLYATGG